MDTFTSNAQRHGVEGTFLCTIPAEIAGSQTPSGHGNWVRIAKNKYAFTAVRAIMNGATLLGWAKFWGTITPVSDDELTGTINAQFYRPTGRRCPRCSPAPSSGTGSTSPSSSNGVAGRFRSGSPILESRP